MKSTQENRVCVNSHPLALPAFLVRLAERCAVALTRLPLAVELRHWTRYCVDLLEIPPIPMEQNTVPVDEWHIRTLRFHPDAGKQPLSTILRMWDRGFREGYLWEEGVAPMYAHLLFLPSDNGRLRDAPGSRQLYPPLPDTWAHIIPPVVIAGPADSRRKMARFTRQLFLGLRRRGITHARTLILEEDEEGHRWAEDTSWTPGGCVTEYRFNLPFRRSLTIVIHRSDRPTSIPFGKRLHGAHATGLQTPGWRRVQP